MKKIAVLLVALSVVFAAAGCGSAPTATSAQAPSDVPGWFLVPPKAEDVIYGVGAAKMQTLQASRTFAENRARVSIAQAINSRVQNMITDYMSGSEGSPEAMQNFQESVSRSLTDATLSGVEVSEAKVGNDGTVYILCAIPKDVAKQQAIAKIGENPNRALAQRALGEMDAAFDRYNNPPAAVTN
jgi:hypothetical protein